MSEIQSVSGRVVHALPEVWPGYLLVGGILVLEIGEALVPARLPFGFHPLYLVFTFAGTLYWWFYLYRIHLVLAEATNSAYPIGPIKAVGFLFIPFFNIYWMFKWPKQIAEFVNSSAKGIHMARYWPGFFLFLGICLSFVDVALNQAVVYTTMLYINRKLSQVLVPSTANVHSG